MELTPKVRQEVDKMKLHVKKRRTDTTRKRRV